MFTFGGIGFWEHFAVGQEDSTPTEAVAGLDRFTRFPWRAGRNSPVSPAMESGAAGGWTAAG